eukprot:scaffold73837_cov69-Phaeocystis_antarctica.AAC.3
MVNLSGNCSRKVEARAISGDGKTCQRSGRVPLPRGARSPQRKPSGPAHSHVASARSSTRLLAITSTPLCRPPLPSATPQPVTASAAVGPAARPIAMAMAAASAASSEASGYTESHSTSHASAESVCATLTRQTVTSSSALAACSRLPPSCTEATSSCGNGGRRTLSSCTADQTNAPLATSLSSMSDGSALASSELSARSNTPSVQTSAAAVRQQSSSAVSSPPARRAGLGAKHAGAARTPTRPAPPLASAGCCTTRTSGSSVVAKSARASTAQSGSHRNEATPIASPNDAKAAWRVRDSHKRRAAPLVPVACKVGSSRSSA